jgi:hypothetical protein
MNGHSAPAMMAKGKSEKTPCIPENREVEFQGDLVEEIIQTQYEEDKNMMTERLVDKYCGNENIPNQEITTILEILFKFNNLTAVSGHSEDDVVARDFQSKSPTKRRLVIQA